MFAEISLFFSIFTFSTNFDVQCTMLQHTLCRYANVYSCVGNAANGKGYWLQHLTAYFIVEIHQCFPFFLIVSTTKGIILFHVMFFLLSFYLATGMELIYTLCHDFNYRRLDA